MFTNTWFDLLLQDKKKKEQEENAHPLASLEKDTTPEHPQSENVEGGVAKYPEKEHPLASLQKDNTPEHPQSSNVIGGVPEYPTDPPATPDKTPGLDKNTEKGKIPSPTESDLAKEAADTREELGAQADALLASGGAERENANAKNDALYEALRSFTEKQDGRYDGLLQMILENDYRAAGSTGESIFYDYLTEGKRTAKDTAATAAADNGGNGDSYSAALAARAMQNAAREGDAAAREYYGEQLDRILKVLQAAGGDMTDLFGATQNNVDTAHGAADKDLSLGADLLKALSDAQEAGQKIELSVFSELLEQAAKNESAASNISPMEIDREYAQMTSLAEGGGAMLPADALIALWQKYPDMQSYILQKYQEILNPSYNFGGN